MFKYTGSVFNIQWQDNNSDVPRGQLIFFTDGEYMGLGMFQHEGDYNTGYRVGTKVPYNERKSIYFKNITQWRAIESANGIQSYVAKQTAEDKLNDLKKAYEKACNDLSYQESYYLLRDAIIKALKHD